MNKNKLNIPIQYCIVPKCPNATGSVSKIFIKVPIPQKRRELWLTSVKRKVTDYEGIRAIYVCEDHFDLKNDMFDYEKYMKYRGHKKMKPDIVPHLNIPEEVSEADTSGEKCNEKIKEYPSKKTKENSLRKYKLIYPKKTEEINFKIINGNSTKKTNENTFEIINGKPIKIISENSSEIIKKDSSEKSSEIVNEKTSEIVNEKSLEIVNENSSEKIIEYTHEDIKHDPEQLTHIIPHELYRDEDELDDHMKEEYKLEPIKISVQVKGDQVVILDENNALTNQPPPDEEMFIEEEELKQDPEFERSTSSPGCQPSFITFEPFITSFSYFDIPKEDAIIANYLYSQYDISILHSSLFVKKLKTAASFKDLAKELNIHESHIIKIYTDSLPKLYKHMKSYIFWPQLSEIQKHLPIYFRLEYKNLESIIDVLQINIEKPDVVLAQSYSWSVNKLNKTEQFSIKYLISHTADGLITYVSPGFAGRTYELTMFDNCEYDSYLSPNTQIIVKKMKNVVLRTTFCRTKNKVIKADKSSALKSETEKGLRSFLKYKLFQSHLEKFLVPYADLIITIAAAWRNLEKDDDYFETRLIYH